ncbi:MAG: nickel pincer cofactor biosynthesis protein LarC [Synergistota bacterium]|nr:nickel pincer cofactor biosynthesis protein LarC [Synergistota bacterium]
MGNLAEGSKILYLDCYAGIAGDMFLAALIDMTGSFEHLKNELNKMPLSGYSLDLFKDKRGGISGLRFDVDPGEEHLHRHLSDIKKMILGSALSDEVKKMTVNAFTLLAEAEGKVHGEPADQVHFHEVGAVDSIIDMTGVMIMLEYLGWPEVVFSPLNVGSGTVRCAHGVLPVPAPATLELLKGISVYSEGDPMERVTPTGAVLVKSLGGRISAGMPHGIIEGTGIGLGSRDGVLPNILRATMIEKRDRYLFDRGVELSANIDDMFPQDLAYLMEKLFDAGALDVWFENIQMKKGRPAVKVCVLCHEVYSELLQEMILRESSSLGVRKIYVERTMLERSTEILETSLGRVRIKMAAMGGKRIKEMPEFEDIKKIASEQSMPLSEVRSLIASERKTAVRSSKHIQEDYEAKLNLIKEDMKDPNAQEADVHHHGHHHPHRHEHDHSEIGEEGK